MRMKNNFRVVLISLIISIILVSMVSAGWWDSPGDVPEPLNPEPAKPTTPTTPTTPNQPTPTTPSGSDWHWYNPFSWPIFGGSSTAAPATPPETPNPVTGFYKSVTRDVSLFSVFGDLLAVLIAAIVVSLVGTYYKNFAGDAGKEKMISGFGGFGGFFKAFGLLFFLTIILAYFIPDFLVFLRLLLWPMFYWEYNGVGELFSWDALIEGLKVAFTDSNKSVIGALWKTFIQDNITSIIKKGFVTGLWVSFAYSLFKGAYDLGHKGYEKIEKTKSNAALKQRIQDDEFREMVDREKTRIMKNLYKK